MVRIADSAVDGGETILSVDQLLDAISKANGGAEVKLVGYQEFANEDLITQPIEKINEGLEDAMKISPTLHQQLKSVVQSNAAPRPRRMEEFADSLKPEGVSVNGKREIKCLRECYFNGNRVLIAISTDDQIYYWTGEGWLLMGEPAVPDLPQ